MKLKNILHQPFPLNPKIPRKFIIAACFGIFVTVFLLLFKPFQLDTLDATRVIIYCIVYGLVTFSCIVFMIIVIPLIFPSYFKEEQWTVGREILHVISSVFLIGLINYLISHFMIGTSLMFQNILRFQFITISIGILPITIFILFTQNQQLKKYSADAASLQQKIAEMSSSELNKKKIADEKVTHDELISIQGDYQKEKISVLANNLLYVTTANNYVKVYYLENNKVVYSILRITMKRVEDALLPFPNFFRCHRTHLINLYRVKEVIGNAQGYKIKLQEVEEMIPVSRNLNSEFSDKLLSKKLSPS